MADFYQFGPTTLHDLNIDADGLDREVSRLAAARPATLIVPMVHTEAERQSFPTLLEGLRRLDYLHELVVPLTAHDEEQVRHVSRRFDDLPMPVRVLWCESPAVREVLHRLADAGLDLTSYSGKGLAVWLGFGVAQVEANALAVHDADIENYDPRIVDRLLFPVLSDELDFYFAKGYYARITNDRLYGRVVRTFVWPFIDSLQRVLPEPSDFLRQLRGYRYPLSGEMALTSDLARNLRMPTDWGLEVGLLGEVHRNSSHKRVCQVDLGLYSHKHKKVGSGSEEGLQRMVREIATAIFRLLASSEGAQVTPAMLTTLRVLYRREAQDAVRRYHADSLINLLDYDRHEEEVTAETFERLIPEAGRHFFEEPMSTQISEWLRAMSACSEAPRHLRQAAPTRAELARLTEAAASSVS